MTTPLKALIQERLRAKIVRQEVDGDDVDDMDDLLAMDTHHHHHREHQHRHHHHHHHRDLELQSPTHLLQHRSAQRNAEAHTTGNTQRMHRQPQHQVEEDPSHGNQYQLEETSAVDHRQKQQPQLYSANQKLLDYYTYEHHQKFDGYFRQDRSFDRGFHDERYKTLSYEEEEDQRSPLPSPWRTQSASNQFEGQDPEEETHGEEEERVREKEEEFKLVGGLESPRYTPLPPRQQQSNHRSQSADRKHVRDRVHPADLHGFRNAQLASPSSFATHAREPQPETDRNQQPLTHEASDNNTIRERLAYPRGHFESQLHYDVHDTKQEEDPTESHHEAHRHHQRQHKHRHHHHKQHHGSQQSIPAFDSESPCRVQSRKRGFGTFDDPHEVDDTGNNKSHERLAHRRHYGDTANTSDNTNLTHTEEKEPALSYSHRQHQQQPRHQHHHFNHDRFGNSAFYVDNLVTSPLAAASSLAPLVFAAATSPRLETKRSGSMGRQQHRQIETGLSSSYSAAPSLGTLPAPLDMATIETTRRGDGLDAMPQASDANNSVNNNSSIINRRSSSTLLRRLDAMLSPGCHRAATAFVEKRRRRAANSTPRTMATQRWLQSMDPHFRERATGDTTACQDDHHQYQETPAVVFSTARSTSSCSNRSSSSSVSSCASLV